MFQTNVDDVASDDGVRPLLVVAAASGSTPNKPLGFKKLILGVCFVVSLKRTTATPPVDRKSTSRASSSRSFTVVEVDSEGEEDERERKERSLKRIVEDRDLKALEDQFGGVQSVVSFLHSEPQAWVTGNEGLERSVRGLGFWDWGSFFLFSKEYWDSSWQSFNSFTIFVLIIAAELSFAIGSLEQGLKHGWHDAVGILVAVFILVFFPPAVSFHRTRAEEKERLKFRNNFEVSVERGGIRQMVSVSDVKVGEIIHLEKGDRVSADGLLISGKNLILDEVINSKIDPHRNPFLFSGSVVEYGEGVMIAVSTGDDTVLRKSLLDATVHPSHETPLQSQMNKPYEFIEKFSLAVSILTLLVILIRFFCGKPDDYYNDKPETKGKVTVGLMANVYHRMFLKSGRGVPCSVTLLLTMVIGIQHGMPLAITVSLGLWREKIRRSHGGKSPNLIACGTLGLVSAVCINITGELPFHELQVEELLIGEEKINPGVEFHPDILEGFEQATRVLCVDPETSLYVRNNLLSLWANSGLKINIESLDRKLDIVDHKFLNSEKGIGVLVSKNSGDTEANLFHVHCYGDASTILNMCSQYYNIRGTIHDIGNQRDLLEKVINDMTIKGLRTIAFACKHTNDQVFEEVGLKLLGFVGLKYSCEKMQSALKAFNDGGVRIVLTSEGELSVATAVAAGFGIQCVSDNQVVEGERFREIMKIDGMEKNELMESITIMGKATSEDRRILIQGLKAKGHVVASYGGLTTSDAPTLMEADVGVAQENLSTEVARTVSDLTCEDAMSLNLILTYGRYAYLNIQKFYQVQLTASISGLLVTLFCTMISGKSPITTIHFIWVTLIMCLLGSMMMVMKLNGEEVKIPLGGDRNQSLITKIIRKKIVIHVLYQTLLFLLSEYLGRKIHLPSMNDDVRHTMIFNTFILCQICNLLGAMGLATEGVAAVCKAVLQSLWFLISLVGVLAAQVMVIEFVGAIVNGVKLSAAQWAICCLFASLSLTLR